MPKDRQQIEKDAGGTTPVRTPFTRERVFEILKKAEPGVAELTKRQEESASRLETAGSLRLR